MFILSEYISQNLHNKINVVEKPVFILLFPLFTVCVLKILLTKWGCLRYNIVNGIFCKRFFAGKITSKTLYTILSLKSSH